MSESSHRLISINRKDIQKEFLSYLKIDLYLMNKKEKETLDRYIDGIISQPYNSIEEKVDSYVQAYRKQIHKDLCYVIAGSEMKNELLEARNSSKLINKEIMKILQFHEYQYKNGSDLKRKKMLDDAWNNIVFVNRIRSDFSEVMNYLNYNQTNEEAIKKIANKLKKEQYRIQRKNYSFDAIIDNKQIKILNFKVFKDTSRVQEQRIYM